MKLFYDGRILGVAFKANTGEIYTLIKPNRHNNLQSKIRSELGYVPEGEYGFYTASFPFMDRFISKRYARKYLGVRTRGLELNSEHLW